MRRYDPRQLVGDASGKLRRLLIGYGQYGRNLAGFGDFAERTRGHECGPVLEDSIVRPGCGPIANRGYQSVFLQRLSRLKLHR